jgi:hypothetical protein
MDRDADQFVALARPHYAGAHAVHAFTGCPPTVRPLAHGKPRDHAQQRHAGQDDNHSEVGQLEAAGRRDDRSGRGKAYRAGHGTA